MFGTKIKAGLADKVGELKAARELKLSNFFNLKNSLEEDNKELSTAETEARAQISELESLLAVAQGTRECNEKTIREIEKITGNS